MQPPIKGTENEYPTPLFAQGGVGCERCHGPGEAPVKGAAILNPAELPADRRDSVCMQCHLEGMAVKQSPDDPAILSGLAYVELNRGAVDHARKLYQKALCSGSDFDRCGHEPWRN
jgi:hypothetical protein